MNHPSFYAGCAFLLSALALGCCLGALRLFLDILSTQRKLASDLKSLEDRYRQNARHRSDQHLDLWDIVAQLARRQGILVPEPPKADNETTH